VRCYWEHIGNSKTCLKKHAALGEHDENTLRTTKIQKVQHLSPLSPSPKGKNWGP